MADLARPPVTVRGIDALAIGVCIDRTQRRGQRWNRILVALSVAAGAALTLGAGSMFGIFASVVVYFGLRALFFGRLERRGAALLERYTDAFHRRDLDAVRAFHRVFREQRGRGRQARALADFDVASELILEERWSEARERLRTIDLAAFPEESAVVMGNNLAFVTAFAGDPAAAIPLAREVVMRATTLAAVHRIGPEYASYARGTLGIALGLAGEHEEAIEILGPLADEPAPPSIVAVRAFHLGESLRSIGDHLRAAEAYAKAETDADGPWATRAKAARLRLAPHR